MAVDSKTDNRNEFAQGRAAYRPAFPSYKVFIYGQDVTEDVVDVRPNHAGGSAERSTGSCSFTLVNPNDKYIVTPTDVEVIAQAMENPRDQAEIRLGILNSDARSRYESLENDPDSFTTKDEELLQTEQRQLSEELEDMRQRDAGRYEVDWTEKYDSSSMKSIVYAKKSSYTTYIDPVKNPETDEITFEGGSYADYPYQAGDCIFHPNDDVRVAFRDPFDPRVWYWMFSGFMDSFTENKNENNVSTVNITCTDVLKVARYSLVFSPSIFDEDPTNEDAAQRGVTAHKEPFAGFTPWEVLESLFFGSKSLETFVSPSTISQVARMDPTELVIFLEKHGQLDQSELVKFYGTDDAASYSPDQVHFGNSVSGSVIGDLRSRVSTYMEREKTSKIRELQLPGISHPDGTKPKRRSDKIGIHAYFIGEMDDNDAAIGQRLKNFHEWNEILHHRVRKEDLRDLVLPSKQGGASSGFGMSPEEIVTAIGTNIEDYPVGGGRVFYAVRSQLTDRLSGSAFDKAFGGLITAHAEFRDRLSFLFDMAERIDHRFYATPKGDIVFEQPFYDNDVADMVEEESLEEGIDKSDSRAQSSTEVFGQEYDGKYDDISAMTEFEGDSRAVVSSGYDGQRNTSQYKDGDTDSSYFRKFDYLRAFTIEEDETYSFSNTSTDSGVVTFYRCTRKLVDNYSDLNNPDLVRYSYAQLYSLQKILGTRMAEGDTWGFVSSHADAREFSALMLNRLNAEQRNIGINIIPSFGLMVNRPIFWRARMYQGNIVSLQHSIVWDSDASTTVNINQVRGWDGTRDEQGRQRFKHFGNANRPFNWAAFTKQDRTNTNSRRGGR